MNKNFFSLVVLFGIAAQLQLCSKEYVFCETDNRTSVQVEQGDTIDVVLEGNPTTGFTWDLVAIDKKILSVIRKSFVPSSALPGSGGEFTFKIVAVSTGNSSVHIKYARPWEKDVEPARIFDITVSVK